MPIFLPDNEPYLGRESVFQLDQMILAAMEQNRKIAPWTHGKKLIPLQLAATELVPHGFSIALSIRELVRQGYLISAEILLRPLIERAAVLSYLCETPAALPLWEAGWPHKTRPPLYKMLVAMRGPDGATAHETEEMAKTITQHFNAVVHADPQGARRQAFETKKGMRGYSASAILNDIKKCDDVCFQTAMYLIVLSARASQVFSEALAPRP